MTTNINLRIQSVKKAFVALLLPALTFALAEKTYSQDSPEKLVPYHNATEPETPATPGVSKQEMDRFYAVMEKHTRYPVNTKGRHRPLTEMDTKTMNEEFAIYSRMNEVQQLAARNAGILMYEDNPVKNVPATEMFENWKKPRIFGIWIDGKHVPNSKLDDYKNTDIAEYTLHKLVGKGLRDKGYKYQLELTTNEEFDRTFEERLKNRVVLVRFLKFKQTVEASTKK
jgi:bla regulator protein blaR1